MIDILLVLIILSLLAILTYERREAAKERKSLLNAIVAKNTQELSELNFNDKVEPEPLFQKEPDLVSTDTLSQDDWEDKILGLEENERPS